MAIDMGYYAPDEVSVSILGKTLEGFSEDSFVSIEPQNESLQLKTSMDGFSQAVGYPVKTHIVKISLQQTSPSNTVLHTLMTLHKSLGSSLKLPLIIRSAELETSFTATDVWFKKEPTYSFGSGMGIVEWEFFTKDASYVIGGNDGQDEIADMSGMINQAINVAGLLNVDLGSVLGTLGGFFS